MIIITGIVILAAAVIAGVAGVLAPCSFTASSPARWQCSG